MWPRFNRNDVAIIAHYLGLLMMTLGLTMAVPLGVAVIYSEWASCSHYIFGIGVALFCGALLRLTRIEPQHMGRKHAIAITGMIWIVGAFLAAVPLYLSGQYASFIDAVFEGVSGLTATGLSLARDVDHMSMADSMWRFTMQFVGGQGVVVVALSLGIFTRMGNALYSTEARDESVVPSIKKTARFILQFSTAVVVVGTVITAVILLLAGMEPLRGFFHALWITIGAYDTGGFAPVSLSLIPYHSWPLEIIAMVLMLLGALSFSVLAQVNKGNWREFVRDIEVRTLALWTVGMVVVFISTLTVGEFLTDFSGMMRRGIFTIISAASNTGFQVLTTAQITRLFSSGAFLLIAISMAIGGSSASTAGGIKAIRVGLIIKGIGLSIRRVLQPRSAQVNATYNHIGRHQLAPEVLSSALIVTSLYVIGYLVGALVGIAYGYDALSATFESISAGSNAGLTSGIIQVGMPEPLKVFYILQMCLGRLEYITLLALFAALIASLFPQRKPRQPKDSRRETGSASFRHNLDSGRGAAKASHLESGRGSAKASHLDSGGFITAKAALLLAAVLAFTLVLTLLRPALAEAEVPGSVPAGQAPAGQVPGPVPAAQVPAPAQAPEQAPAESAQVLETTISELAGVPRYLDQTMVQFEGEVVGDRILAGHNQVWITMADNQDAITVLLPEEYERLIVHYGNYANNGTRLLVQGEFRLACPEHDGVSDVHVTMVLDVIQAGGVREHPVRPLILAGGLGMIIGAGGLWVLYGYLRRKRR